MSNHPASATARDTQAGHAGQAARRDRAEAFGAAATEASPPAAVHACDIAIVGAGPVGLTLANLLVRRGTTASLSVVVIDAQAGTKPAPQRVATPAGQPDVVSISDAVDARVLALSHGSRMLLEPLGWPLDATPIERIHVSQRGHFGRTEIDRQRQGVDALGYVVRYPALVASLRRGLASAIEHGASIRLLSGLRVTTAVNAGDSAGPLDPDAATARPLRRHAGAPTAAATEGELLTLTPTAALPGAPAQGTRQLRARIVIHAEGKPAFADIGGNGFGRSLRERDYGQTAIVASVRCTAPRRRVAWERFTDAGPLALLPVDESGADADYALVWCQSATDAERRFFLDDHDFLAELGEAFGARVGRFTAVGKRARYPLQLRALAETVRGREVAIGNAAQTLHPVAGQGLNLGLRDVQALAQAIGEAGATPAALLRFAALRRRDRAVTIALTDVLARSFAAGLSPVRVLGGAALAALDVLPGLKSNLARQMIFGQRD